MVSVEINNLTAIRVPQKKISAILNLAQKTILQKGHKQVSLAFVVPASIKRMNDMYRHKAAVTDVLSFEDNTQDALLGEIIICSLRAQKQARELKHSLEKEILRLVLHGYLHLSGYDHIKNTEAVIMERLEEKILNKFYA